jgi:hypothetical protein
MNATNTSLAIPTYWTDAQKAHFHTHSREWDSAQRAATWVIFPPWSLAATLAPLARHGIFFLVLFFTLSVSRHLPLLPC